MLTVKNISTKIIGFGIEHILPDQTVTLPKEYNENHPTIKFYLDRGWLAKSSEGGVLVPQGAELGEKLEGIAVERGTQITGSPDTEKNSLADEHEEDQIGEEGQSNLSKRNLDRMKIEDLKALAAERKLQVPDNCTKDAIVKIIIASFLASEQQ